MSERETLQNEIAEWLNAHRMNSPFLMKGIQKFGRGKARNITFSVPRYLDAHLIIVQPDLLLLNENHRTDTEFHSVQELYDYLLRKYQQ